VCKYLKNERINVKKLNKKWIAVGALAAVLAIGGVAFAAFSQTLTIRGGAAYDQNAALVRWQIGSIVKTHTGGGSFDTNIATSISANQLLIASYMVEFSAPGSATLQATVENVGSEDATVTAVNTPSVTCTAQGAADATFATALCGNITYVFEYADGATITVGDVLAADATRNVRVVITLSAVPTVGIPGPVTIAIGDQTITYEDAL
jgi:hypothetical protein